MNRSQFNRSQFMKICVGVEDFSTLNFDEVAEVAPPVVDVNAPNNKPLKRRQRLASAFSQIPSVIIAAIFSKSLAENANTKLSDLLSFIANFLIHFVYTEPPSEDPEIKTVEEIVTQFERALKKSAVKETTVYRYKHPEGFWEISADVFVGRWSRIRESPGTQLSKTPETLAKLHYFVYSLLYDREAKENAPIITTTKVPEGDGIPWFINQFSTYQSDLLADTSLSKEIPWEVFARTGNALSLFLGLHHPEAFPVKRKARDAARETETTDADEPSSGR